MKLLAKCLALSAPLSGALVVAWWTLLIRGPVAAAPLIALWMVGLSSAAASLILIPAFNNGHFEPLRKQRIVFAAVGLVFLIGLLFLVSVALSQL